LRRLRIEIIGWALATARMVFAVIPAGADPASSCRELSEVRRN
jgi:hypothetical protein